MHWISLARILRAKVVSRESDFTVYPFRRSSQELLPAVGNEVGRI